MKNKREKIVGTVVPTELLNLTAEQALDRLAKKYYGTLLRKWCSRLHLWSVEPKQMVGIVYRWVYDRLFPASPTPASMPKYTCIVPTPLTETEIRRREERATLRGYYMARTEPVEESWARENPLKKPHAAEEVKSAALAAVKAGAERRAPTPKKPKSRKPKKK